MIGTERESAGEDEAAEVRQQSDLTMAVWRACPSEDPCRQLPECQLYGQAMESGRGPSNLRELRVKTSEPTISCRSLQRDHAAYPDPTECPEGMPRKPAARVQSALSQTSALCEPRGFQQWDDGFKEREDTCLCLKLMADDSSDECRQAWSRYSAFAEQLRAEYRQRYGYLRPAPTSSNTPPASEPATSEPDAAGGADG